MSEAAELARRGLSELGGAARGIGDVHLAMAGRVFRLVGPQAAPVRLAHDAISRGVYAGLHGAAVAAGHGAALAARGAGPVSRTPQGARLVGILNGLIGDTLEAEGSALAVPMSVARRGEPSPRLVVFLHGLMETENSWRLGGRESYGERLERELGCTAVELRYNTGRRISENGRSLCELMTTLVEEWPVEVEEIALVGHSMGGLVARSACHRAALDDREWVRRVRHVISLGSPHMGAPLEQAVHYAAHGLHRLPETRPLGRFLRRRSGGIRDLRQGSLVDEDWRDRDPEELRAVACAEVPLLDGATHCFVSATITRSPRHPLGRLLGDLLVLSSSASGRSRTRRLGFRDEDGLHVGGANHFALLNHPKVYAQLREWLRRPARRELAAAP
ncbi:MAG TPA: alpha/beta fold hydrolase [Solirubrobacteraceae bacterium]|nr:alpha/beta fold hydrolase [Solirubrobacteraceae bacterium]